MKTQHDKRFLQFKYIIKTELGNDVILNRDNTVTVKKDEFNPEKDFRSLQAAIDSYSRYLPVDFVNILTIK